jgi:hypothetical protein
MKVYEKTTSEGPGETETFVTRGTWESFDMQYLYTRTSSGETCKSTGGESTASSAVTVLPKTLRSE